MLGRGKLRRRIDRLPVRHPAVECCRSAIENRGRRRRKGRYRVNRGPAGPAPVQERAAAAARETDIAVPAAGPGSGLHRNTNLENISDALTKGLLAIGASQLYRVDGWVRSIAPALGESFGPANGGQVVALSVVTYGAIEGFLFGYLATRIYLTGVFERSDPRP